MVRGGIGVTVHCGQSGAGVGGGVTAGVRGWVPEVVVCSFGYLHGGPPAGAVVVVDVRVCLRDPHVDPGLRELTGHDPVVVAAVLATPGARGVIDGVAGVAAAVLGAARRGGEPVRVAVGCAGGRHRSVVLAEAVAGWLAAGGWAVVTEHLDLHRGVVRSGGADRGGGGS